MNRLKQPAAVLSANPAARQSNFDNVKIDSAPLERILKLSKGGYAVFRELGQGREIDEIAKHLKKDINAIHALISRMRPKLGIKTMARLRFEATRYVLSGIERGDHHFVHFVFPQGQEAVSCE